MVVVKGVEWEKHVLKGGIWKEVKRVFSGSVERNQSEEAGCMCDGESRSESKGVNERFQKGVV